MTARELIIVMCRSLSDCVVQSIKIYFRAPHEIGRNLYSKRKNKTLGLQRVQLTVSMSLVLGHNYPSHLLQYFVASALTFFHPKIGMSLILMCAKFISPFLPSLEH